MTNTEQPIWKPYPGYPFVEANQFGEIRTIDRYVQVKGQSKRLVKGRVLKQQRDRHGYMKVHFRVDGESVLLYVHRVVAASHLPNPDNLPEVNHKDNDPTNNRLDNLEWCTCQYNQDYKRNFGTSQAQLFGYPVIAVNPETSEVFYFESQREAARQLDVDQSRVAKVVKGKRYHKTGGYWFCRVDKNSIERTREKFGDEVAEKVKKIINKNCN